MEEFIKEQREIMALVAMHALINSNTLYTGNKALAKEAFAIADAMIAHSKIPVA